MITAIRASSSRVQPVSLARRALTQTPARASSSSSKSSGNSGWKRRRYLPIVGLSALAMSVSGASLVSRETEETKLRSLTNTPRGKDDDEMHSTSRDLLPTPAIQSIPTSVLVRTYLVYTLCSIPLLIDYAPSLLHTFTHSPIPGVKQVTEAIVRRTFFAQFVPGESVEECLPTMRDLRKNGIGAVLNYSAEVSLDGDEKLTDEKRRLFEEKRLQEVEKALIESGRFETQIGQQGLKQGSTSFALKVVSHLFPISFSFCNG
jgi:hypothetical protein